MRSFSQTVASLTGSPITLALLLDSAASRQAHIDAIFHAMRETVKAREAGKSAHIVFELDHTSEADNVGFVGFAVSDVPLYPQTVPGLMLAAMAEIHAETLGA